MSSAITLDLTINGVIGQITLVPKTLQFVLSGQEAGLGPQAIKVPAAAVAASVSAQVPTISTKQGLLLIHASEEVTYQINGDLVDRTIAKDSFAAHPGDPIVTTLAFGGNGSTDAEVTIFHLGN